MEKPIQLGGAKFQDALIQWSKESFSVFNVLFIIALVVFTAYAHLVPPTLRYQLSTTLGRMLSLVLLVIVYETGGWIPALLFTIGICIVWFNRPLAQPTHFTKPLTASATEEGFESGVKTSVNQTGFRWFVERVLGEKAKGVQEDRISIGDVQDDSVEGNSRTSQSR